jgi:hypothetical protein
VLHQVEVGVKLGGADETVPISGHFMYGAIHGADVIIVVVFVIVIFVM